ncbi:FRE7 [Candida oxycetoniae]|uniref:ferric-chelate reductase (NADPH) n=1 Tax=Candida oxycetoniae TaxID=497107 RepID=A0AAI9SXP1_9ASCO|nr:FRE7 [Candida oxycetoniae]KAI3404765.2 FRE7 [Candida oxycetoniae]
MQIPWAAQAEYAKYTVYFGIVVISCCLFKHLYYRIRDLTYKSMGPKSTTNPICSVIDVAMAYGRYIGYKQTPWVSTQVLSLPNSVGATLFMSVSSLYLLCYCFVPHFWYRPCSEFGSPPLAVRAGVMSTALFPFIYVLAGKSNAITLLTGTSYEKLNLYHQYVGCASFVLAIVHTIPFLYQSLQEGGATLLHHYFTTSIYYISGIPCIILLGLLCVLSKAWVRKHFYEVFVHLHWMMGVAFFGVLIWHINQNMGAQNYMWGALAFWATQIIYRLLTKTCFKPNAMFLRSRKAHLEKLGNGVYQIKIENVADYKWSPGQHCFLRFQGWRILDSHPFSIASTCDSDGGSSMKFIVIPQKGLTKVQYLELNRQIEINKKVYIDGPYGGTFRDPTKFDKIVLIASGSGVSATLPFLIYMSQQEKSGKSVNLKCINFIWIVRKIEDTNWIREELNQCQAILGSKLQMEILVCHRTNMIEDNDDSEKSIESKSSDIVACNVTFEKPNVSEVLKSLTSSFARRNLIVSSGSISMKRQVSSTVSQLQELIFNNDLKNTNVEEIYLHTESFGW